jgi:hypothetical protein
MVLCGGAPGKRLATPNAKIMIHQGSARCPWGAYGLIDEVLTPERGVSAQPLAGALAPVS